MNLHDATAAALKGGGIDLSHLKPQAPIDPTIAIQALIQAQVMAGLRCVRCAERIEIGYRMTRVDIVRGPGGAPQPEREVVSACDSCAAELLPAVDVVERIEMQWLRPEPKEIALFLAQNGPAAAAQAEPETPTNG